jgi:hypothetical protein
MLARGVEIHLHAIQTTTEQLQLCEWGFVFFENCIFVLQYLDHGIHMNA